VPPPNLFRGRAFARRNFLKNKAHGSDSTLLAPRTTLPPRVGIAWQPLGSQSVVAVGGMAGFYDLIFFF